MSDIRKLNSFSKYKNIIGDTQDTIRAIQNFIGDNKPVNMEVSEEDPAASINRVLNSNICEDTNLDIQKIIKNL